jgi:hypothetical protein
LIFEAAVMTESTLPSSTKQFNKELDAQILKQEPPDDLTRDAPWWQRRHWATLWSTIKKRFQ